MILQYNQNYEANTTIITNLLEENTSQNSLIKGLEESETKLKTENEEKSKNMEKLDG